MVLWCTLKCKIEIKCFLFVCHVLMLFLQYAEMRINSIISLLASVHAFCFLKTHGQCVAEIYIVSRCPSSTA